jgi:biotin carboxylase
MLGTNRQVAVVLGGTSAHGVLIEKLKVRGYRTVLVDYLENPPAKNLADVHLRESTLEVDTVTRIARDANASIVIATSVDQANVVACEASERLGLPHPYSGKTGHIIANKKLSKRKMVEQGLPTARHISLRNVADLNDALIREKLNYPLIVKPADSNGSKGVVRCDTLPDLEVGLRRAIEISRTNEAIIEDFIDGVEFNIYALIIEGKPHLVSSCRKYNHESTDGTAITSFATWYQNQLPDWFSDKLNDILTRISSGFKLHNTVMILQVLVRDDDVFILEFAPRVGGGLSYWAVALQADCDLVDAMIDAWLGIQITLPGSKNTDIVITTHLYAQPCTFDRIEGVEQLLKEGTIESYIPNKMQGENISAERASRDRVGSFVLRGESDKDILSRVRRIMDMVEAYDVNGRPVTNKDIYLRSV